MNVAVTTQKRRKGYIKSSTLVLLAFATAFFPRVLEAVGAPPPINFLHFTTITLACGFVLFTTRTKNLKQISIAKALLSGLLILLGVITASALVNNAGAINVVLDFLLLAEPFILLLAIVCIPMSLASTARLQVWFLRFESINFLLAFSQFLLIFLGLSRPNVDDVKGVFIGQGGGHVVGASVSMTFGLYYLVSAKTVPIWIRVSVALATFWHMLVADAKQVLLTFLVAWLLLLLTKLKDVGEALKYWLAAIVVFSILIWCTQNVPAFDGFNTWFRPEIYGTDGEATMLKSAGFRIIHSYYESPLNWLLGLGPGHTIGRLGGWMLKVYWNLLEPLGATTHPASTAVWTVVGESWLGNQSSMFSPLFGWAGIWGDLGIVGLGAYLYLGFLVWSQLCVDDLSRFLLLTVFVFGLVFSQMEEPGYMLFVASLIGLRWQENRLCNF